MSPPTNAMAAAPSNAQFSNPTPYHLRALVLDYLCHNSCTETARSFALDSAVRHLDADGDEVMAEKGGIHDDFAHLDEEMLRTVELRKQIRTLILSGCIKEATDLLNEHFPSVLSEVEEDRPKPLADRATPSDRVQYVTLTSVDPTHLSLNLRIQAFAEASRTVPLTYDPSSSTSHAGALSTPSLFAAGSPPLEHDDSHQEAQLRRAQKLWSAAQALRNPADRATYLTELLNISGLLAYKTPEDSPVAKYLTQERREAVANQINSAILHRLGKAPISYLELYARYTTTVWSVLRDMNVKRTSLTSQPAGVQLPPSASAKTPTKTPAVPDKDESVPKFDLHQYLEYKG